MVNEYLYKVKECNPLDDVRTYLRCLRGGK
jgi:hypothetical protein